MIQANLNYISKNKLNNNMIPIVNLIEASESNTQIKIKQQILNNLNSLESKLLDKQPNEKLEEKLNNLSVSIGDCIASVITTTKNSDTSKPRKIRNSDRVELKAMKTLLNQDFDVLSKDSIFDMMLFGISNNIPKGKFIIYFINIL